MLSLLFNTLLTAFPFLLPIVILLIAKKTGFRYKQQRPFFIASFVFYGLALAAFAATTYLACPPLAPYVALGFATHLVLDALTYRGLRLFWPTSHTLSARLCKTGGVVDACCLVAALAGAAALVWQALP